MDVLPNGSLKQFRDGSGLATPSKPTGLGCFHLQPDKQAAVYKIKSLPKATFFEVIWSITGTIYIDM